MYNFCYIFIFIFVSLGHSTLIHATIIMFIGATVIIYYIIITKFQIIVDE